MKDSNINKSQLTLIDLSKCHLDENILLFLHESKCFNYLKELRLDYSNVKIMDKLYT